jgi:hypothetical protein
MQADSGVRYSVLITGDHSTPVMFGDHSHEPVPVAIADVAAVVKAIGVDTVKSFDLGPLPPLTQHVKVDEKELREQSTRQITRRKAWLEGVRLKGCFVGGCTPFFDEICTGSGCLGRFPSSALMPMIREVLGA